MYEMKEGEEDRKDDKRWKMQSWEIGRMRKISRREDAFAFLFSSFPALQGSLYTKKLVQTAAFKQTLLHTNLKTLSASMSVAYPPQGRIHRNYGKNYGKNYGEIHVKSGENHIDLIWTCGVYGKGYKKGFCPPVTYQPELWKYQGKEPRKTSGNKPWKYSF